MAVKRERNPAAQEHLLEAAACGIVLKELERLRDKYKRRVDRELENMRRELKTAMEYESMDEIHELYGWDAITEEQYERYTELFLQGEAAIENHAPTRAERVYRLLYQLCKEISSEQREHEFDALTPAEQTARLEQMLAWKEKIAEIKSRRRQL